MSWRIQKDKDLKGDKLMTFNLTVPLPGRAPLDFMLKGGESLFVLGANGSGKSSLMHLFYKTHQDNARRMSAHRQSWIDMNAIVFSPAQKRSEENNLRHEDNDRTARWRDPKGHERSRIDIYNLIDPENVRALSIANAVDSDDIELAKSLSKADAPIKIINEIFQLSNLPIEISIKEREQLVARRSGSPPYSIEELSDGERNALLIAASVLTVKGGTLILIDEPERHLHRSIISPLLTHLFAKRPDCAFVVSTHEVMLPLDNPSARTLLVRGCTYTNASVSTWEADLVTPETAIDDDLRKDILGARRKLLFIEGTEQSLDKPLYTLVFPNISVVAKSSCRDVEHAVASLREASELHWLHAFGIIDNDRRAQDDIDRLKNMGVYALSVFSVESIYYHPEIQQRVAERQAAVTGEDSDTLLSNAKMAAIKAIRPHIQRLSERTAEKIIRKEMFSYLPRQKDIAKAEPINVLIDVPAFVTKERLRLQDALDDNNLSVIIEQYPVRETDALNQISSKLGFQSPHKYEGAVRKLLMDDKAALTFVKSLFGTLEADLNII